MEYNNKEITDKLKEDFRTKTDMEKQLEADFGDKSKMESKDKKIQNQLEEDFGTKTDMEKQLEADFGAMDRQMEADFGELNDVKRDSLIQSKIADLREMQHEPNAHKKFDKMTLWLGSIEEFSIYKKASFEEVVEVMELMEGMKSFVLQYARVLSSERDRIDQIDTYLK